MNWNKRCSVDGLEIDGCSPDKHLRKVSSNIYHNKKTSEDDVNLTGC